MVYLFLNFSRLDFKIHSKVFKKYPKIKKYHDCQIKITFQNTSKYYTFSFLNRILIKRLQYKLKQSNKNNKKSDPLQYQSQITMSSIRKTIPQKFKFDITSKQIYTKDQSINISLVKQMLYEGSLIETRQLVNIIKEFQRIIKLQPNVVKVNDPVIIVGDIHGQFFDLIKVLALFSEEKINSEKYIDISNSNGMKKQTTFVFLGDYVDRGIMAIQVMSVLMLMKIASPKNVVMLRGNHQSRIMAELYNFKQQCNQKYGQQLFQMFMDAFDSLPLACVVNQKYFCVHGGISDKIKTVAQIQKLQRCQQIPLSGPYCDFIWSDPTPSPSGKLKNKTAFNDSRQCSIYFGAQLAEQFLRDNKLQTIIRGHEVFQQGFKSYNWLKKQTPQAITVFSAPNYCNSYGNRGAVMRIDCDKVKIRQYNQEMPQNYRLADKLQVFSWSLQKVITTLNTFSACMLDRICELYIDELADQPHQKQLSAFLYYYQQNEAMITSKYDDKEKDIKKKFSIKDLQEQEKNRPHNEAQSQQYFKESHRVPQVNRFKDKFAEFKNSKNTTI